MKNYLKKNYKKNLLINKTYEEYNDKELSNSEVNEIIELLENNFNYTIRSRGKEYYENNRIISLIRGENEFRAIVKGTENYTVKVELCDCEYCSEYSCTCPCEFPCKHEYAVLLAIKNREYKKVKLKPWILKKNISTNDIINRIPAEELKRFITSRNNWNSVSFTVDELENVFVKYFPRSPYSYYYNNLYNRMLMNGITKTNYFECIKLLVNSEVYLEAFYIIKSLIEVAYELKLLNEWNELINNMNLLTSSLRIIYRKADEEVLEKVDKWLYRLYKSKYFKNLYLEDMVLNVR